MCKACFPPGKKDLKLSMRVMANMIRGHAAAYRAIHELQPEARVGYALQLPPDGSTSNVVSIWIDSCATSATTELNMGFPSAISTGVMKSPIGNQNIPEAKGTQDYFGLNYYTRGYSLV